jgi:hypothetical protein
VLPVCYPRCATLGIEGVDGPRQWCICMYMKRTNIYLREDHLKKLKALSEHTGAPVSALIRKAIEEYLKKVRPNA